ncbi:TetR/AcrR family transcriptional regulator [Arthrobacter sp. Alg241-R88]|uniref:TetR/AcrR family transcriptional regulator n=1 Tax=Arthrobacter sp. Alg241-R88 TaxID=2305984 RepID=UPI0013CF5279|nr:TetR/AcrR family transcriptional regulator [Arthrobacter sp. Alg241-R88]
MTTQARSSRPGPRRTLTEEEIMGAALDLLDEGGVNAASVRGIAARVGVAPNAVYTYFPDKAAVVKAIVEHLLGQVDLAVFSDRDVPWRQRIESLALELRERLTAHPGAVNLMIGGPMDGPRALALNEHLMETLQDSGLDAAEAAKASYLLIVYVFGSIALETAELGGQRGGGSEGERIASRLEEFSAIPAGAYPLSAGAADVMAGYVSTEQYAWGLHKVLDGITRT